MRLYRVKVKRVEVWEFVVRASSETSAECLADKLATGTYPNWDYANDARATEIEDEGQEVDGGEVDV